MRQQRLRRGETLLWAALQLAVVSTACGRTRLHLWLLPDEQPGTDSNGGRAGAVGGPSQSGAHDGGNGGAGGAAPSHAGDGGRAEGGANGEGGANSAGAGGAADSSAGASSAGAGGEQSGGAGGALECEPTAGDSGELQWLVTFGDEGTSAPRAFAADAAGNLVVAGSFGKTLDFGDGALSNPDASPPYTAGTTPYVAKLDAAGQTLWSKALLTSVDALVNAVALDDDGNAYVAGSFRGELDLDPADPGQHVLRALQYHCDDNGCTLTSDVFVAKLGPDGAPLWAYAFGDEQQQGLSALVRDGAGRLVLTGAFRGELDFATPNALDGSGPAGSSDEILQASKCDAYLVQLGADGALLWSTSFGSAATSDLVCQRPNALAVAQDDAIVLAGGYYGPVTLSGDPADALPSVNSAEVLLAKFSSAGQHLFSRGYASASNQYATGVAVAASGELWLAGNFGQTLDFGDSVETALVSAGSGDVFVARFDAGGEHLASARFGDSWDQQSTSLTLDDAGHLTLGGRFTREIDFGGAEPLVTVTGNYGDYDAFVVALDGSLTAVWQTSLGSSANDTTAALARRCDGSLLATGDYGAEATLASSSTLVPSHGGQDLWIARWAPP